jgi:very-short-patch-repair endonuclease
MENDWREVATEQAGAISAVQLLGLGLSRTRIQKLVSGGHLVRVRPGVFCVPSAGSEPRFGLWVVLLACGAGSFACRTSAAELWDLDGVEAGTVEVGVPAGRHPRGAGVIRLTSISADDLTEVAGIPLTNVVRTLADLGSVTEADVVERAVESALRRSMVTVADLECAAISTRSAGRRVLAAVLARRPAGVVPTESDAETRFEQLCRAAGLPVPQRQIRISIGGRFYRLDFGWRPIRLAIEIDGVSVHGPGRLTSDLRRQNSIVLGGWLVLRFTWAMVVHEPERVVAQIRSAWQVRSVGLGY